MKNSEEIPESWAEYYEEDYGLPAVHGHLVHMAPFLDRVRRHAGGPRLLEVGTGTGITAVYLSQAGYEVTGVDVDPRIVALNRRLNLRFEGAARFVNGDMFRLPFRPGTFDLCCHQGLMEHFDPPQIIEALEAQLAVASRVVFTVPTVMWDGGLFGNERLWTPRQWLRMLSPFRVEAVFGMSHRGRGARALAFAGRRLAGGCPPALIRALDLARAGQIGFVLRR